MEETTESTESVETTPAPEQFESTDNPTTISTGQEEDSGYIESDVNTTEQDTAENFDIPTDSEGNFDFDNMTDAQLDNVIKELEAQEAEMPIEKPEYTLPDKFNNVDDLVKSYKMLEGKVGNFKGAPETYSGDMEDPLMSGLADTAREMNMSDEAFTAFTNKFNQMNSQLDELQMSEQMSALGQHADQRIDNINQFLDSSMNPHVSETIRNMATSAESINALESLIQMARPSAPAGNFNASPSQPTDQDIQKMMFAKDDYGNLKMETDSEYSQKVNELMNNTW